MTTHTAKQPFGLSRALHPRIPLLRLIASLPSIVALRTTLVLLLVMGCAEARGQGVPVVRDFEDIPDNTPVFNQYVGVTFIGGDSSNFDGSHPITIYRPSQPTVSASQALKSALQLGCEFCGSHLTMRFDLGQSRVALSSGLAEQGGAPGTLLLEGFDTDPQVSGATLITIQAGTCLGAGPTPIDTPLELNDNAGRIHFARLSLVDCSRPNDPGSGGDNRTLLIDNLVYDRPLNPPPGEHVPPVITIDYPPNASIVQGAIPGFADVTVLATIVESALSSVTASLNGGPALPMAFFHNGPAAYDARIELTDSQGLIIGQNTVVIAATDFDQPANSASAASTFTFQLKPIPPASTLDVWPTAVEVTQTIDMGPLVLSPNNRSIVPIIDGYRLTNPSGVPLLKGKRTLIRIYGAVTGASSNQTDVPATITVTRANCTSNCALITDAPPILKYAVGVSAPNLQGISLSPLGSPGSAINSQIPDFNKTWNFLLPPDWTTQDLMLDVMVNEGRYTNFPQQPAKSECVSGTSGECHHNNHLEIHLNFGQAPEMTVHAVSFNLSGTLNGVTYTNIAPRASQINAMFDQLNEMYPAIVSRGTDFTINASPSTNKDDLLDKIGNFDSDHANEMFIGLLPADQATPPFGLTANERQSDGSFVAGYGAVGGRGAWADADLAEDTAHELGHNIGFDHWACENGVTDDECGVFPIPHGGTGVVGTDIVNWKVIPPGDNSSNSTPHAHDLMSYGQLCALHGGGPGCDLGEWVSWYDYDILLTHFGIGTYDTNDPPALLVRGHIGVDREVRFLPIYEVRVNHPIQQAFPEDDTEELYTFVGRDAKGNILFVQNFEANKMSLHTSGKVKPLRISTEVPIVPSMQRLELYFGSHKMGEIVRKPTRSPIHPRVTAYGSQIWRPGTSHVLRWKSNEPNGTAQILYSHDGGKTLTFVARDILGSQYSVKTDELPASRKGKFYVQISDGMNSGTGEFGPVEVLPTPPVVHIVTPLPDAVSPFGSPLTFHAEAYDSQGAILDAQLYWSIDGTKKGTGRFLTVSKLKLGTHRVTVLARGHADLESSAGITVRVQPVRRTYRDTDSASH